jgi:hypothetical protein
MLQDNADLPIGVGNNEILNYDEDNFNRSDDCYLSTEEEDGNKYGWKEDAPHEQKQNTWPPEMLHARAP